ncbi:MAG: hypothetical protein JSU86_09455 [Phycisphaerales bacterium]|nr:MAG: hypothetical protein JSU86_09455 [Phycisphaerales bacterium]
MSLKLALIFVAFLSPPGSAETPPPAVKDVPPPAGRETEAQPPTAPEGLWPSKKLMNLMLTRWADRISRKYELEESQRAKVRKAVVERWGTFLNENRSTIQPLVNEFVEMRMGLEPPTKEQVQAWAQRVAPAFEKFREQVDQGTSEFREILDPLQKAKFELEVLQVGVGVQVAEQKLKQWQKGEFEKYELWEPTGPDRRQRRAERRRRRMEQARKTAEIAPQSEETDQIALELKTWERYVREFIRIYKLDEGQRTAVLSVLSELKERALAHRDRHREDIAKLERHIETFTGSKEELADLKRQLTELYGPIDDLFKELRHRAESIPTAEQRAAIAENGEG